MATDVSDETRELEMMDAASEGPSSVTTPVTAEAEEPLENPEEAGEESARLLSSTGGAATVAVVPVVPNFADVVEVSSVATAPAAPAKAKRVTRFETHCLDNSGGYYRLRQPQSDSNLRSKQRPPVDCRLAALRGGGGGGDFSGGIGFGGGSGAAATLSLLGDDSSLEEPPPSGPFGEDLCQLCKRPQNGERGVGLQLDERPGVIRWRKLPCRCPDRYLHVACLETSFFEDAVYSSGRRRLTVECDACGGRFVVTHHRGRRACDSVSCMSFARHLLLAGVTSGALIGFGLWSMLHPLEGRPRLVNSGMVGAGCLILAAFAMYEVWLLYCRYEFDFTRLDGGGDGDRAAESAKMKRAAAAATVEAFAL